MSESSQNRIILAVINDLSGDQRLHRICSTLASAGYLVTLVGRQLPESKPLSARSYHTHRLRLPLHRGKAFYLLFQVRLLAWLLVQRVDLITANDLDTLLPCYVAARIKGCGLLYDSHEYFTEVPELIGRPRTRSVWQALERWLLPRLTQAYTVNQSLADIYHQLYQIPFEVIRNVPFARQIVPRERPSKVVIYQGALNVGRGIELMLETMRLLPGYELWIVGRGDITAALQQQAAEMPEAKVKFWGFHPFEEVAAITAQASLGLSLEEDLGANYHYASPNKVYDYLQARIPVIVSDLPEMARVVNDYGCGGILPATSRNPAALAHLIRSILESPEAYQQHVAAADKAARALTWEQEAPRLLRLYEHRIRGGSKT